MGILITIFIIINIVMIFIIMTQRRPSPVLMMIVPIMVVGITFIFVMPAMDTLLNPQQTPEYTSNNRISTFTINGERMTEEMYVCHKNYMNQGYSQEIAKQLCNQQLGII